ncbi:hypothetical protein [Kitasatospora cathayae]|uniref:Thioredoxin domain-containing protein n=1 Tax=Kitasatospora cathayae TaxID=3004092 RepID=A0ABY7QGZ5_9ACTN|nr:hypothetical protein [Kitasatospora sp. HUAS 3-15]WBP91401.1 hypothetical protein O1G21_39670 [Kitasatospora sp. HUAS 3-15]
MIPVLMTFVVLLGIVTAAHVVLTLALVRRLRTVEADRASSQRWPEAGATVTEFAVRTTSGRLATPEDVRVGERLVAFLKAGCGPCDELVDSLDPRLGATDVAAHFFVVGDPSDPRTGMMADRLGALGEVAVVGNGKEVMSAFGGVRVFPTLLRLRDGVIMAAGADPNRVLARIPQRTR